MEIKNESNNELNKRWREVGKEDGIEKERSTRKKKERGEREEERKERW